MGSLSLKLKFGGARLARTLGGPLKDERASRLQPTYRRVCNAECGQEALCEIAPVRFCHHGGVSGPGRAAHEAHDAALTRSRARCTPRSRPALPAVLAAQQLLALAAGE